MAKQVVFVTIGEAPRTDLQKTYDRYFADMDNVKQVGLLNGLSREEAEAKLGWTEESAGTLTSRFADGSSIVMGSEKVERALQKKIDELEAEGADIIVILCTGTFNHLQTKTAQLIEAEKITIPYAKNQYQGKKMGVMVPLEGQMKESAEKWGLGDKGVFVCANPYDFSGVAFREAAEALHDNGAELILLDCMGYSDDIKHFVEQYAEGSDVIQSNDVLFQYVLQLLNGSVTV